MTPSSAEPATILTTQLICPQYNLQIHPKLYYYVFSHSSSHCIISDYHLHYSLVLTLTPTRNSSQTELGELVNFPTSFTSIPNQAFLDHHCTHITRKLGVPLETFHQATYQNATISQILGQHPSVPTHLLATLQLELSNIQDIYKSREATITSAIELLNSNQLQTRARCRRSLLPFPWRCPQLAYRNCHHKGHPQHQNQNKSAHCHTDITTQHSGPHCINIECHQICHTSQ